MKIEIEKNDFIKIVIITTVSLIICLLFYIILVMVKVNNEKNVEFKEIGRAHV